MTINLVIERLVLEGLPLTAPERDRLVSGLTAELARLLERDGVPDNLLSGYMAPRLSADPVRSGASVEPRVLGHHIARAVRGNANAINH